jgi:hypothetical protein
MIRSQQEMFSETEDARNNQPQTRFPNTREEVENETDPVRKDVASLIHQESYVKKTWTHRH